MSLSKDQVKTYLIRDKGFLKELYEGENHLTKRRVLQHADDTKLNTLIKYLHFVATGEIHVTTNNFKVITDSKKLTLITKTVEKKSNVLQFLQTSRENKLKFLLKLSQIYPQLLFALFNER
jgi:hypothetical protein